MLPTRHPPPWKGKVPAMRPAPADLLAVIPTYPQATTEGFAAQAAAVARHLGADVHALVLEPDFPPVASALGNMLIDAPALIGGARARCRQAGDAVVKALASALDSAHVPMRTTRVDVHPGAETDTVPHVARYHDLAMLGLPGGQEGDSSQRALAEALVFGAGRPVLLLPEGQPSTPCTRVLIAWDGSRAAALAVADARPFLQRAEAVTVVCVTQDKTLPAADPGGQLARHLQTWGVRADVHEVPRADQPVATVLQQHARQIGADLLVMGGFGHSRLRDFVLGGATRGLLDDLRVATLLSH